MEKIEKKMMTNAVSLDRKLIDNSDEKFIKINGYACHFGVVNGNGEMVTKDSFDSFFKEMEKTNVRPTLNYMHTDRIIGGIDLLKPDDTGLWMEARIAKTKFVVDELLPLIDAGFINFFSTEGFAWCKPMKDENNGEYWLAEDFALMRVSLVDIPADMQADMNTNAIELRRKKREENQQEDEFQNELTVLY